MYRDYDNYGGRLICMVLELDPMGGQFAAAIEYFAAYHEMFEDILADISL